jgi:hypothetical protein
MRAIWLSRLRVRRVCGLALLAMLAMWSIRIEALLLRSAAGAQAAGVAIHPAQALLALTAVTGDLLVYAALRLLGRAHH